MDAGSRGTIIAGRYQCAGDPRRGVLLDAVDLDAPAGDAGCRLIAVPGDAAAVDAWRAAWHEATGAGLPALRDVLTDEDGETWAILEPTCGRPDADYPRDAERQARAVAEALQRAGLDVAGVRALVPVRGQLRIDQFVRLATGPQRGGEAHLLDLLPDAAFDDVTPPAAARPRRRAAAAPRWRRWVVPLAIVTALVATGAVLAQPTRSAPPAAPPPPDVLLPEIVAAARAEPAPPRPRRPRRPPAEPAAAPAPPTVAAEAPEVADEEPAVALPVAEIVDLPVAEGGLPVVAG